MTNLSDLRPGDILTTPTYGAWYDHYIGELIRWGTATQDRTGKWVDAPVNHAAVYVGDGKIVEAKPHGAILSNWNTYGSDAEWSTGGIGQRQLDGSLKRLTLTYAQRNEIAEHARALVGTPYNFLDLVAIGVGQKRIHLEEFIDPEKPLSEQPWWVQRLVREDRLICSQLVDLSFERSAVQLLADGRVPGLVSPNDLRGLYL